MQMPKNCIDCPACNEYLMCAIPCNGRGWGENDVKDFSQSRPEWCPMKEQPIMTENETEWVNCKEKMPAVGQLCFGAVYGHDVIVPMEGESVTDAIKRSMDCAPRTVVCEWYGESEGWWSDGGLMIIQPRYWQPINKPKPPNVSNDVERRVES